MTYTIIDPTPADYEKALADQERRLEQAQQRIEELEAESRHAVDVLVAAHNTQHDLTQQRIARLEAENRELLAIADNSALILAHHHIADLEADVVAGRSQGYDLRNQDQIHLLEIGELRRALLGLVQRIERRARPGGYVYMADIELQIQDAREVLARAGLL